MRSGFRILELSAAAAAADPAAGAEVRHYQLEPTAALLDVDRTWPASRQRYAEPGQQGLADGCCSRLG